VSYVLLMLTVVVAALVTAALVPPIIRLSERMGLLDKPAPRRVHRRPTSRLGGVAIFAGFLAALLLSFLLAPPASPPGEMQRFERETLHLLLLLAGAVLTAAVMLVDDVRGLSPQVKLAAQLCAALVAVGPYLWEQTLHEPTLLNQGGANGIILTAFNNPLHGLIPGLDPQIHLHNAWPPLAIVVTVLWVVGMMNTVNMVDGIDGLAGGVTLIAASLLAIHALREGQTTVALLPLALAGACLGFLPYNFHPARIFMGDTGAMTIGYILGLSAIIGGAKMATALLVLAVPILDVAWLIVYRTIQGRGAHRAGRDHLHHRLFDLGLSQRQVVLFYYLVTGIPGLLALALPDGRSKLYLLLGLGALILLFLFVLSRRPTGDQFAAPPAPSADEIG
jgi:UDP-GlcNAc:undecaprenyl-phosphate GlcNAc-1-phosphate transferase